MSDRKKVLITGGAGFIGSNLGLFLQNEYEVHLLDNLSLTGQWEINTKDFTGKRFTQDLLETNQLNTLVKMIEPDVVIHLAAESHVDNSLKNSSCWQTNVIGTESLFSAIKDYCPKALVINQITDEVFGPIPVDSDIIHTENNPFNPTSPYACSKAAQFYVGEAYRKNYGLNIISTFPSNIWGPRQWPNKLIPKAIVNLLLGKKVQLMKSSHFQRQWLHVDDFCRYVRRLLELDPTYIPNKLCIGGPDIEDNYNIALRCITSIKGWDSPLYFIEWVPDRKAHDSRYTVSCEKIQRLTNIWPIHQINGLPGLPHFSMKKYYRDNLNFFAKVVE